MSSTFYDLRYVREGLKRFIESLGYIAVLSEDGGVFYDTNLDTVDSCTAEVFNADLFVLLIGGRYGSIAPKSGLSVTNTEYLAARESGVPIFAMVEEATLNNFAVYSSNSSDPDLLERIQFPSADDNRIFDFIHSVRESATNNALVPFRNASDIEEHLRQQWAALLHSHLKASSEAAKVTNTLEAIAQVNTRVEFLAERILGSVGNDLDRATLLIFREMLVSQAVNDLRYFKLDVTPASILSYSSFEEYAESCGITILEAGGDTMITSSGEMSVRRLQEAEASYARLREMIEATLTTSGISHEQFKQYDLARNTPTPSPTPQRREFRDPADLFASPDVE